tara:strand:+ start:17804 stop:18994 length:1191 start_codon:yes stop_codon:yes gene_type:complete
MKGRPAFSILLVAPHPFFTERGTPIAVREAAMLLNEAGFKVTILTFHLGDAPGIPGVEVLRIPRIPGIKKIGIGFSPAKLVADAFLFVKLGWVLLRKKYHAVHAVEESVFLAWFWRIFFRYRLVYDMDSCMSDQIVEKWPKAHWIGKVLRRGEQFVMRRVDFILPVCPALADTCRELAPKTPLAVLHDVPPPQPESKPKDLLNLRELVGSAGPVALYVGNFEGYQGVDLLLEAMEKIDPASGLRLVLIGGGENAEGIRDRVESGCLAGRVFLPGSQPLEYLPFLLDQADILVSPRIKGVNTPMKVYAYLRSGRSILATRILSHTQVVNEDQTYLVEPTSTAIAEGLECLTNDPALRDRLGESARFLSKDRFSRERLGEQIASAYDFPLADAVDESQ